MFGAWKHIIQHVVYASYRWIEELYTKKNTQNTPTSKEKCASILVCHQVYGYTLDACCSHDIHMRNSHKTTNPSFLGIFSSQKKKRWQKKTYYLALLNCMVCSWIGDVVLCVVFLQPRGSCCIFDRWKSNPYTFG